MFTLNKNGLKDEKLLLQEGEKYAEMIMEGKNVHSKYNCINHRC